MSRIRRGRPRQDRPATYTAITATEGTATAHVSAPCRGRTRWLAVVLACAYCEGAHVHLAVDGDRLHAGELTRRCPATGREYRLGVAGDTARASR